MICATKYCRNEANHGRFCKACDHKKWRIAHPLQYAYNTLRQNAKRRGKAFDLSLADFAMFCTKTLYLRGKGRAADSFSIDRIDNSKGYTRDNIQVLTLAENSSKRNRKMLVFDYQSPETTKVIQLEPIYKREGFKRKTG